MRRNDALELMGEAEPGEREGREAGSLVGAAIILREAVLERLRVDSSARRTGGMFFNPSGPIR